MHMFNLIILKVIVYIYVLCNCTGAPLPPHQPSEPDPDYVQCPHCERRFQESAAERHIPFCKEQKSRIERKPSSKAQGKLNKRLQVNILINFHVAA